MLYLNLINILKEYKKVNREQGIKKIIKQFKKDIAEEDSDSITLPYEFSKDGSVNLHKSTKKDEVREVNATEYIQIVQDYYEDYKGNIILPKKYEDTATALKIDGVVSEKKTDKIDFDTATQKEFLNNIKDQVDNFLKKNPAPTFDHFDSEKMQDNGENLSYITGENFDNDPNNQNDTKSITGEYFDNDPNPTPNPKPQRLTEEISQEDLSHLNFFDEEAIGNPR